VEQAGILAGPYMPAHLGMFEAVAFARSLQARMAQLYQRAPQEMNEGKSYCDVTGLVVVALVVAVVVGSQMLPACPGLPTP